jgi:cytochrome c oxidase subunit 2
MRRDLVAVGVLWAALTALFLLASSVSFFPFVASREAVVADDAFRLLMRIAAPVFALVLAVLAYSLLRFRGRGDPPADAPFVREHPAVARTWFVLTAALAAYVMYNPGLVGLAEMRGEHRADLVVRVEAMRWGWKFTYPEHGVTSRVLVLPVNRRVQFAVTSVDVLHAFWVPAFRTKVDAVPGLETILRVTPTTIGSGRDNFNLRVRCAELCGLGHDVMHVPVRILEQAEFDRWVAAQKPQARGGR